MKSMLLKTTCNLLLTIVMVGSLSLKASAQQIVWSVNNAPSANIPKDKAVARQSFPAEFKLFNLNIEPLRQQLFSIVGSNALQNSTVISLPNADGSIEQFEVYEASNFEPDLQAQFPDIRAYSGKGITDKYATLKLSISPQGIQTMVFRTDKENEFIEPYSEEHTVYAVFRSHREKGELPWTCSTDDKQTAVDINSQLGLFSNAGQLKTMRLAQSCNGEYANFFGATSAAQVALVLAAYNATLTRCNGVYEKDLALHLNLIANTTSVIYYNPSTDPYTTLSNWNSQLQSTLTSVIGEANYDIGHMFGASGGGGNAGCIGCVCTNGSKGSGITSPADGIPQGDNFDIDYVVHEVGHQLGANHTFSHTLEGSGVNKEVGSGITIMGYAGITSRDVAPHSIDIFHEASIAQIQSNLSTKTCPVTTSITANNATPVVAGVSNYIIPISTPFALTGSATDANGDPLTYCWEQNDNATTSGANSVASPTKATGPNWLSFSPTASPTRLFPKLSTILSGLLVTPVLPGGDAGTNIEALSSVSRTLNFRLTVRDNSPYVAGVKVGQTQLTDMTVTVTNTSGPFQVTSPNTNVSWAGGSVQTITWNQTNTTLAPVSCANVKISLSTDGGTTFPTVISASTANDGSEVVTIPAGATTTARMKVEAVGNIFFDISNTDFSITASTLAAPTLVFPSDNVTQQPVSLTIRWNTVATATSYRLQVGTDSTFAGGLVVNDSTLTDTSRVVSGLNTNTKYFWRVNAKNGTNTSSYSSLRRFTTIAPPSAVSLVSPVDNVTSQPSSLTIRWNTAATALSYRLQVATDSTFVSGFVVNDSTISDTSALVSGLSLNTKYFWRVRGQNGAGNGASSAIRRFTTLAPPAAVALVSPADNVTGQAASLTVRWNVTSTAISYRLQVSSDSTFAGGFVVNDSTIVDTSSVVSGLSLNTRYFWRVCGQNAAGNGAFSVLRRFTTLAPPAAVALVSPADNVTGQAASLTVRWNSTATATAYRLQVSSDSMFAGGFVVNDSTIVDTSSVLNGLLLNTRYFWRVSGENAAGIGGWSSLRRFTTLAPPAAVTLVSPADNATGQSSSLTVRWNATSTATSYILQVSSDSTFGGGLVVNDSTATDTFRLASGFSYNTVYFWRVSGVNAAGIGGWSSIRRFTTLVPPAAATLVSPIDDAAGQLQSLILRWRLTSGATSYAVQLSADSTFTGGLIVNDSTLTDTLRPVSGLGTSTSYFWRVRALNVAGSGPWSPVWKFTTVFPPATIVLVSPIDDAQVSTNSVALVWQTGGPIVTNYWVEWSSDSTFASAFRDSTVIDTSFVAGPLADTTLYWWRAKAKNVAGWGTFSSTRKFTTAFEVTVCVPLQNSWNLVSLPVEVANDSSAHLFNQCPGCPFTYIPGSGYVQDCSLHIGSGYWLKCTSSSPCITGSPVLLDSIPVVAGWNLIGSISVPLNTSAVSTVPSGIVSSNYFGYLAGYTSVTTLSPGGAYWVKVSQAGVIILDGTGSIVARPQATPRTTQSSQGLKMK